MRVCLDARWIFRQISGIGAHTRQLIRHLAPLAPDIEYLLLFSDPGLRDRTLAECGLQDHPRVQAAVVPWGVFSPLGQLAMPAWLRRQAVDVFHSPNYMIPLAAFPRGRPGRIKAVVTVHDLIPLVAPAATPRALKRRLFPLYRRLMLEVGARADRIIAVSEVSRQDVIRHLGVQPLERVRTIYNGVDALFTPGPASHPAAGVRTILYVGRSDPYKNLCGLVRAFAQARQKSREPLRLRIVGPSDPRYPEPAALVGDLGLSDSVEWTGYVADQALVNAYRSADVLVLPSRFEGFGFPVVEAMACAIPVVCSDIPVLREVAGDAAEFAPADDHGLMASAMLRVLTDAPHRQHMVERGLARAAQFSWDRVARETLALYREAVAL